MARTLEELIILKRTALRYLLARESRLLALGKKPVNKKISNFVRQHQENTTWSNFCDSLNEDLTRNINIFEWRFREEKKDIRRRRFRLFSESKEALNKSKMFSCGGRMSESPVVRVEQGQLQGKVVNTPSGKGYFAFQGVPYAKPPIGSLRFKDPQPHEPWEGVRDATTEGSIAPQIDIYAGKSYEGDENCLYLNVYSPNLDGSFLPVMVYIHGGGLTTGSGNTDMYGPDYLVEKDVVVVTINYRLGPLGFLCLNTPEVPGNAGLKDVILALRWVKENIHNFGGNAGNLTIFGESAGGAITSMLTAVPIAKNLFSRAIVQSGTALVSIFTQNKPIENARRLAKALGCEGENVDEILEFLTSTPAKDIIEAITALSKEGYDMLESKPDTDLFSIVVEKEFLGVESAVLEPFLDLFTSGRVAQVPIMVGTTTLEFGAAKKVDDLQLYIPQELHIERDSETSLAIADELRKLYFRGGSEDEENCQLFSDKFINVDTHRYIQYLLQSTNVPVYFYKFGYVGELNIHNPFISGGKKDKAVHLDELGYLFKNDFQKDVEPTAQDLKTRERMVRLWTNFAKTGNPTPDENHIITVTWPPVTKDNETYLLIGNELSIGTNYDKEKMDFWDQLYSKYYKTWEQPQNGNGPVIIETLTVVSNEGSKIVETIEVIETSEAETGELVVIAPEAKEPEVAPEVVKSAPEVAEIAPVVAETAPEVAEIAPEVTETAPEVAEIITHDTIENGVQPHVNGNSLERKARPSNEIKMVQNSNGVPKDVIRANDPPEDDLPKNIGVNKFVNFFESLGGKK